MAIVLDAMGSDKYPDPEIQGALHASETLGEEIILVGNQELIGPKLSSMNAHGLPVRIHHAPDVVEMGDKVVEGTKKKPENSMAVGLELVKNGTGKAFVTAGNTGAAMFNGLRILGRIKGVQRPGLITPVPTIKGQTLIMDIGANADCRPEFLLQFGLMGSIYAQKAFNIKQPRVGLLSNGEEAGKGNQLVKDAFKMFENSGLNFVGNVEPKEVFGGFADVVITDGFTGNILIKTSESIAKFITDMLKQELMASLQTKVGALFAKPAFGKLKKLLDPADIGAAALLGIDGLLFVGHGRSDEVAIASALRLADQIIKANLLEAVGDAIQKRLIQASE
jgi:glycerol-3-phosphate acyltransferase PlsX